MPRVGRAGFVEGKELSSSFGGALRREELNGVAVASGKTRSGQAVRIA